jgi:signal transduction histidine kinase
VVLEVEDHGVGFREDQRSSGTSLGVVGMRERARFVGADLTIRTAPGRGTIMTLRIPDTGRP